MKSMYIQCKYESESESDTNNMLSNTEYITHIFEPQYTIVVSLVRILSEDIIRYILKYLKKNYDLSARTICRLRASILDGNFENFKFIYDEYMQCGITNFFEYEEEYRNYVWNFYSLCDCWCDPIKMYRGVYIQQCGCANGKRYLAFKMIYSEAYEILTIYKSTNKRIKCSKSNNYQRIVDYIIRSGPIILDHSSMIKWEN